MISLAGSRMFPHPEAALRITWSLSCRGTRRVQAGHEGGSSIRGHSKEKKRKKKWESLCLFVISIAKLYPQTLKLKRWRDKPSRVKDVPMYDYFAVMKYILWLIRKRCLAWLLLCHPRRSVYAAVKVIIRVMRKRKAYPVLNGYFPITEWNQSSYQEKVTCMTALDPLSLRGK